jgi:hypothetical protein
VVGAGNETGAAVAEDGSVTACVIGQREHPAAAGYLCLGHLERLGAMLRDIEEEAALLSSVPSMAVVEGTRGGAPAFERAPARLDVIVHNDQRSRPAGERPPGPACPECWHDSCIDIRTWTDAYDAQAAELLAVLDVLHSWARLVREERELSPPGRVAVTTECATLMFHREWLSEQPWIDEMYADIRTLLGQLRSVNATGPDKALCQCPVVKDGRPCTGQVWVHDELQPVWRRYVDRCSKTWEHAPGAAICDTCGTSWVTLRDRARLERMRKDAAAELTRPRTAEGNPMLTAQELVDQGYVTSLVNVRVIAHRRRIVSVDGHYDPQEFGERDAAAC